jgi:lysophospholipase-2
MPLPGVKWIFPGAPNRAVTAYGGRVVPAWYDMSAFSRSVTDMKDDERGLAESVAYVRGLVMDLVADGIPPGRIVLGGFSQGGAVAITAALSKMDDRFGGVGGGDESAGGDDAPVTPPRLGGCFLLSSYLPLKDRYPSPMLRGGAEDTPVFIAHGREDTILPFYGYGWITGEKLKQFMTPGRVAFNEIPEMGHERLGEAEVTLLRDWLVRVLGP